MTSSRRWALAWVCCWCVGITSAEAAPDVRRMWFTPAVVPENYTQPVRFEAAITESPPAVVFEYDGVNRPMYDDGTHGDLVAGDGTWTLLFEPHEIFDKLTPSRVFRPFIGFCKPAGGGNFNVFAEVWTSAIGLVAVQTLDGATQQTSYVVNLAVGTDELLEPDYRAWAQRFYAVHGDDFDFLNFVQVAGLRGNRFHSLVKNDVAGLGLPLFDDSATFGSNGRLKGFNVFPISSFFDAGSEGFSHETGHQWINFLHGTAFASGIPHWPRGDIAINVMGFSLPGGVGGTYSWTFTPNGQGGYVVAFNQAPNANTSTFNSMELYLMGLAPASEVETFFVLNNQLQDVFNGQILQPADVTLVDVGDVVAAVGPREPDSTAAQKAFRVATIVVSEQPLDIYAMSLYDWFARRAEATTEMACAEGFSTYSCKPFYIATGGRATMASRIAEPGAGPVMALDRDTLRFGAVTEGVSFVWQTAAQTVRLTQSGDGTVNWTATSNQPWLTVTPVSGTGSAELSIGVTSTGGLPAAGSTAGAVTLSLIGAGNALGPIDVTLTTGLFGTSHPPFGVVDTPLDHGTGVSGAVPFTGWALDDIDVESVAVCRAPGGVEAAPVDPNCGGAAQIFIGHAVFIEGARPDVQVAFPAFPRNSRAGWGLMVLTNMLPDVARGLPTGGNGTYTFYMYARDREGHVTLLATRTLTCDNEHATRPFGAIDTPGQGAVVSGSSYVNFGWTLTPTPKFIPQDGSTIHVFLDGVAAGNVSYNHFRADIAGFFPGLANSNGAVGFRVIDTTTLTDGLHTIAWGVSDNEGATEGIGSRFFTISNGAAASTAAASTGGWAAEVASAVAVPGDRRAGSSDPAVVDALPVDGGPIRGRRGFHLEAPLREYAVGASGRAVVRGEELDRFELHLSGGQAGEHSGYLRVGSALAPLPIGSRLNAATGVFTWAAGVGFAGTYDLVFVRSRDGRAVSRQDVRFVLAPKGSGRRGPQVAIDTPRAQQDVAQPFLLAGWAADLGAEVGTGIDTLHVWAYPLTGEAPVFLGVADYGGARADVAAVHGAAFRDSGYGLLVQGLEPGNYDLAVFGWSTVTGGFVPARVVRVTVR